MTCEPADLRDPETALRRGQDACAITDNADPAALDTFALAQHPACVTPAAVETEKKALALLPPDAPGRGDCEADLARLPIVRMSAGATSWSEGVIGSR